MNASRPSLLVRTAPLWLSGVAVLIALLIAEGLLRAFPGLLPEEAQLRLMWRNERDDVVTVPDPYVGFRYKPGQKQRLANRDFDMEVATDEKGFRNAGPWPERADVVIVGDSMAFGYGVPYEKGWSRLLGEAWPKVGIVNLGLPGAAPQQYTRHFEIDGVPLRPRLLIYSLFPGNDAQDAEYFDAWLAAGSPGGFDTFKFFSGAVPQSTWNLRDHSYVVAMLHHARKNLQSRYKARTLDLEDGGRVLLTPGFYERRIARMTPDDPGFRSMIEATRQARRLADDAGARMIVAVFPTKEEVYLPVHGEPFGGLVEPVVTTLRREGFEVIDLTEALREAAAKGEQVYFEVDGHPNERGNELIAEFIQSRVVSEPSGGSLTIATR